MREALECYGLGRARIVPVRNAGGRAYRLPGIDGHPHLLRVALDTGEQRALTGRVAWLEAQRGRARLDGLVRHGLPEPVPTLDGEAWVRLEGTGPCSSQLVSLERLPRGHCIAGRALGVSPVREVGAALGQLHAENRRARLPGPGWFPRWDASHSPDGRFSAGYARVLARLRVRLTTRQIERIDDRVRDGRDRWLDDSRENRAYGLIHADLGPECALLHETGVAFLGFDHVGWGCCGYDVASLLFSWVERADYADLRDALLSGYAARASELLPPSAALVSFQALRGACLIARAHDPALGAPSRNDCARRALDAIVRRLARAVSIGGPS